MTALRERHLSADNLGCKGRQFLELQLANVLDRQVRLRRRRHVLLKLDLLKVLWRPSTLEQSSPEKKPVLRGRGSKHPDVWLVALPCLEDSLTSWKVMLKSPGIHVPAGTLCGCSVE